MVGLVEVGFGQGFQICAANKLFFRRRNVINKDNVNVIERSQFLLDDSDSVFAPEADSLSMLEVHSARLGCSGSVHHPKKGCEQGPEQ